MGMYDIIHGEQVKCFYTPCLSHDMDVKWGLPPVDRLDLWGSTGNLITYHFMDKVPYKTMWYDYTKNFMIFDPEYLGGGDLIHVVKGGRYIHSFSKDHLNTIIFPITVVIDYYGNPLNIKEKSDFYCMKSEHDSIIAMRQILSNEYEKAGESPNIAESKAQMNTMDNWMKYKKKWFNEDEGHDGPWNVGAFLYALDRFCRSDEEAEKFVKFFNDHHKDLNVEVMVMEYAYWCATHGIPMQLLDLQNFFISPTVKGLHKLIWRMEEH